MVNYKNDSGSINLVIGITENMTKSSEKLNTKSSEKLYPDDPSSDEDALQIADIDSSSSSAEIVGDLLETTDHDEYPSNTINVNRGDLLETVDPDDPPVDPVNRGYLLETVDPDEYPSNTIKINWGNVIKTVDPDDPPVDSVNRGDLLDIAGHCVRPLDPGNVNSESNSEMLNDRVQKMMRENMLCVLRHNCDPNNELPSNFFDPPPPKKVIVPRQLTPEEQARKDKLKEYQENRLKEIEKERLEKEQKILRDSVIHIQQKVSKQFEKDKLAEKVEEKELERNEETKRKLVEYLEKRALKKYKPNDLDNHEGQNVDPSFTKKKGKKVVPGREVKNHSDSSSNHTFSDQDANKCSPVKLIINVIDSTKQDFNNISNGSNIVSKEFNTENVPPQNNTSEKTSIHSSSSSKPSDELSCMSSILEVMDEFSATARGAAAFGLLVAQAAVMGDGALEEVLLGRTLVFTEAGRRVLAAASQEERLIPAGIHSTFQEEEEEEIEEITVEDETTVNRNNANTRDKSDANNSLSSNQSNKLDNEQEIL